MLKPAFAGQAAKAGIRAGGGFPRRGEPSRGDPAVASEQQKPLFFKGLSNLKRFGERRRARTADMPRSRWLHGEIRVFGPARAGSGGRNRARTRLDRRQVIMPRVHVRGFTKPHKKYSPAAAVAARGLARQKFPPRRKDGNGDADEQFGGSRRHGRNCGTRRLGADSVLRGPCRPAAAGRVRAAAPAHAAAPIPEKRASLERQPPHCGCSCAGRRRVRRRGSGGGWPILRTGRAVFRPRALAGASAPDSALGLLGRTERTGPS